MFDITFDEFLKLEFKLFDDNPVIKPPLNSFVIADPSVLTPDISHDNKFHLFCHTFFGIFLYSSDDGVNFKKTKKITNRAMRPNINYINGTYYLFYERTKPVICNLLSLFGMKWKSEIYCRKSLNLTKWEEAYPVIKKSEYYHEDDKGISISNPFLLNFGEKYRLYYSSGQTFINDCGFCEPTFISFAESCKPDKEFVSQKEPVIKPDKHSRYTNLCSGCLKVYKLKDCYIGFQNGIFEENGKSHSAIILLKSFDGISFEEVKPFLFPQRLKNSNWMAQYVYACCLTQCGNKLRLYFNARNVSNNLLGREAIGIYEAEVN